MNAVFPEGTNPTHGQLQAAEEFMEVYTFVNGNLFVMPASGQTWFWTRIVEFLMEQDPEIEAKLLAGYFSKSTSSKSPEASEVLLDADSSEQERKRPGQVSVPAPEESSEA